MKTIDADIQTFLGQTEGKQLLHHSVVVPSLSAGDQILRERALVDESAQSQVGPVPVMQLIMY